MSAEAAPFLVDTIGDILTGSFRPVPQDDRKASLAPLIRKEEGLIDWKMPAFAIRNLLRAFTPWPGIFFPLNNRQIKVVEADAIHFRHHCQPGTIHRLDQESMQVCCGDDTLLRISSLQPPAKSPCPHIVIPAAIRLVIALNNRRLIELAAFFFVKWRPGEHQPAPSVLDPLLDSLKPEERPKLTATVMGILRRLLLIEHLLSVNSSIPMKKIHPKLRSLLLVSIYQLLFDDSVPDHAVLSSAVSLCIPHHRSFANAILRNITRNRISVLNEMIPNLPLSVRTSFPEIIMDYLGETFPDHSTSSFLDYLNTEPVFHSIPLEQYKKNGSKTNRSLHSDFSLMVPSAIPSLNKIRQEELLLHEIFIQNISSQFVSYFSARLRSRRVLDLCSAPGSKSALLTLLSPQTRIASGDLSFNRLLRLLRRKQNSKDLLNQVSLFCGDATAPPFNDHFDLILLDAPCSALGTIRKNPDRRTTLPGNRLKC